MANLHKIRPEIHILYFPCGNNDAVEGSQAKKTKEKHNAHAHFHSFS